AVAGDGLTRPDGGAGHAEPCTGVHDPRRGQRLVEAILDQRVAGHADPTGHIEDHVRVTRRARELGRDVDPAAVADRDFNEVGHRLTGCTVEVRRSWQRRPGRVYGE